MKIFRKIEEALTDIAMSEIKGGAVITLAENGFDLKIRLGPCLPVETGDIITKLSISLCRELSESGYELDGPFRIETEEGEIILVAEFYDERNPKV